MKKITTLALATLFCLAGCNKGPAAISYKEWRAKAIATQPEAFAKVTASYEVKATEQKDATGTIEYTYDSTEKEWTTTSNDKFAELVVTYIQSANEYASNFPETEQKPTGLPEGAEVVTTYYDNLSVYSKISFTVSEGGMTATELNEAKLEFAQGNWLTLYSLYQSETLSGLTPAMEEATGYKNGTVFESVKLTFSYSK